jgi:hypothetical protein
MRSHHVGTTLGAALAILFVTTSCSDSAGVDPDNPAVLSAAEVRDIGDTFEEEADLSFGALFHRGTLGWFDLSMASLKALFPPGTRAHLPSPLIACLSASPLPIDDPDADGVPTDLTISFDPAGCEFTNPKRGVSFALTGSVNVSDPLPNSPGYDVTEVLTDFGHTFTSGNGAHSAQVIRNGTRSVSQAANLLTAAEQLVSVRSGTLGPEKTAASDWMVEFTGDADIMFGDPLPSGSISVEGAWTVTRGPQVREFVMTTVTPLVYDAGCTTDRPSRRITAGELHAEFMVDGMLRGTLSMVWAGCGTAPTRQFTPA